MERSQKLLLSTSTIFSGGLSTCCARTAAAPLERLKILFQGQSQHYKNLGVITGLKKIYCKEGILGFYRGHGAMLIRTFPHGAIQFLSYEKFKQSLESMYGRGALTNLISGSLAGLTSYSITYPLDTVRCRLAFQVADEQLYSGIRHAITVISKEGGYAVLYRGFCTQALTLIPTIGLSFFIYESIKETLLSINGLLTRVKADSGETVLSPAGSLACGATAGVISQTIAYPLDVVKRRMQLASSSQSVQKYSRCFTTLMTVYTEDGLRNGLYRGLSINYLRVVPQVAVMFGVYELSKQLLTSG